MIETIGLFVGLVVLYLVTSRKPLPRDIDSTDLTFALKASGYRGTFRRTERVVKPLPAPEDRDTLPEWLGTRITRDELVNLPYRELRRRLENV